MEKPDNVSMTKAEWLVFSGCIAWAVANLLWYAFAYGGDGEIHLIFADNFLHGHFLQFNIGEPNGGETSIGFFLIVTVIVAVFGMVLAPVIIKLLSYAAMIVIAVSIFRIARRIGMAKGLAAIAGVLTLGVVGTISEGASGTENTWFAAGMVLWFELLLRKGAFELAPSPLRSEILFGGLAGLLFWIRPEMAPVYAVTAATRLAYAVFLTPGAFGQKVRSWGPGFVVSGILFAVVGGASIGLYFLGTGLLPFSAGAVRRIEAVIADGVPVGPFFIAVKVLVRMVALGSIVFPAACLSLFSLWRVVGRPSTRCLFELTIGFVFFACMAAYVVNLLPTFHLARYTIYLWPLGLLLAVSAIDTLAARSRLWPFPALVFLGLFFAVGVLEDVQRFKTGEGGKGWTSGFADVSTTPLVEAMYASQDVGAKSDDFLRTLGNPKTPVVFGAQEVQIRRWYDDRFIIRALDGVTDPALLKYIHKGYFDHDGYFIDQHVDAFIVPQNYNRDKSLWSIQKLLSVPPGQSIDRPGIRYTVIAPGIARVTRLVEHASDRHLSGEDRARFALPPL